MLFCRLLLCLLLVVGSSYRHVDLLRLRQLKLKNVFSTQSELQQLYIDTQSTKISALDCKTAESNVMDNNVAINFLLADDAFLAFQQGIQAFRQVHKHVDVPYSFVMPTCSPSPLTNTSTLAISNNWPGLNGYPLGQQLMKVHHSNLFHDKYFELKELGITPSNTSRKARQELFVFALECHQRIIGHMRVARKFIVPVDSTIWPCELAGYKLGDKVANTRFKMATHSEEFIKRLNDLGFVWHDSDFSMHALVHALTAFKTIHGHTIVPKHFIVPYDDPRYPEEIRGMRLGPRLNNFNYRRKKSRHPDALVEVGLDNYDKRYDSRHWNAICLALVLFKSEYGHVNVPLSFVVPFDSVDEKSEGFQNRSVWPKELWGLKLGYRVNNIRYRGDFVNDNDHNREFLDSLGFVWKRERND